MAHVCIRDGKIDMKIMYLIHQVNYSEITFCEITQKENQIKLYLT